VKPKTERAWTYIVERLETPEGGRGEQRRAAERTKPGTINGGGKQQPSHNKFTPHAL